MCFSFSQDFVDNSNFGWEKIYCLMKIQNNSPHKYVACSLVSYYLSLVRSGISWIKLRESSVNIVTFKINIVNIVNIVLIFTVTFCYHVKRLSKILNFLKIDKDILSDWYQNIDDKLIRECTESILSSLDSRLIHRS